MAELACDAGGQGGPGDADGQRAKVREGNTARAMQRPRQGRACAVRSWAGADSDRRRRSQGHGLQGELLDAVFAPPRDAGMAYDAYVRFRDGGSRSRDLDIAFARALPVIREVCTSRDRVLIGAAAWAVWRALRERRFTAGKAPSYWAYLRKTARGAIAHQRAADQRFRLVDRVAPDVCTDGMRATGRLPGLREIEQRMVVEKIPVLVTERVVRRLPFDGEELEASLFFLETLLDGRDVEVRGLVDAFDVRRERLREILDYVVVEARMAMSRIRIEIRAAAGGDVGWQGALSMSAWLYGEDEEGARGE